jgi:ADP-ribose pyrophosphatase YjhB (NUDIX family)
VYGYVGELRRLVGTRPLILCGASAIVLDPKGRLLLVHRTDYDMWSLPGGAAELGERLEDTAVREVHEEVGLTCHRLKLFGVYSGPELYFRYPNGDEVHPVIISYLCREFSGTIQVDYIEAKEAAFVAIEGIPSEISPIDRFIIEDLVRRYDQIVEDGGETGSSSLLAGH